MTATNETRFLGLLQGHVPLKGSVCELHHNIPMKADDFVFSHPDENRAVLCSVTPNVATQITLHRPKAEDSSISISVPGVKEAATPPASVAGYRTISTKSKVKQFKSRVCEAMAQHDTLKLFINKGVIANTVNLTVNTAEDRKPFVKLRQSVLEAAEDGRLRKLGGHVWRPVAGCQCAYVMAENYRDFLNATLNDEPAYHERPSMQRELIDYLVNYNPKEMRDVEFERGMLSFCDGVLIASMDRASPCVRFVPYNADNAELMPRTAIARHHINSPYAPPSTATPLFDGVLETQFQPPVIICLARAGIVPCRHS